jgi:hypothetical protein
VEDIARKAGGAETAVLEACHEVPQAGPP